MELSKLKEFCSDEPGHRWTGTIAPCKIDDHIYATDTKIGIRVPQANVSYKFPPFDQMDIWSKFPLQSAQEADLADLPEPSFSVKFFHGSLSIDPIEEKPFNPAGLKNHYELKQLRKIASLPKVRWQEEGDKLLFEFGEGGQGVLMAMALQVDYIRPGTGVG